MQVKWLQPFSLNIQLYIYEALFFPNHFTSPNVISVYVAIRSASSSFPLFDSFSCLLISASLHTNVNCVVRMELRSSKVHQLSVQVCCFPVNVSSLRSFANCWCAAGKRNKVHSKVAPVFATACRLRFTQPTANSLSRQLKTNLEETVRLSPTEIEFILYHVANFSNGL